MSDFNVKLYNDNDLDHKERYKGAQIIIKAHDYIEMDYDEARQFMGQYFPYIKTKGGTQDPKSYKMLRIDEEDAQRIRDIKASNAGDEKEKVFVCQSCGNEFRTKKGLLKHIKSKHSSEMVDKEARDELLDDEDIDVKSED